MNRAICVDNRFEIIEKAKQAILEETNIKDDKAQMAELDSFLFRCWQMGWLKKYEQDNEGQALLYAVEKTAERTKKEIFLKVADWLGKNLYKYAENIRIIRLIKDLKQVIEDERDIPNR